MDLREKRVVSMIDSDPHRAFKDCEASIDMNVKDSRIPLFHLMLTFPWRDCVIKKIKAPLQIAIQNAKRVADMASVLISSAAKLREIFGELSQAKILDANTICLLEHKERFKGYEAAKQRILLESSAYDIFIAENEHDTEYRYRIDAEIEWIIEDILAGKWRPRPTGCPTRNWNEPVPYGGEHSIVCKLQKHREEILKLIEGE